MRYIDVTGKTEEEAVRKALEQLHLERDDVSLEILERSKSGFLGIGSSRPRCGCATSWTLWRSRRSRPRPPRQSRRKEGRREQACRKEARREETGGEEAYREKARGQARGKAGRAGCPLCRRL